MNPNKDVSDANGSGVKPGDFARLALWMTANLAGMVTAVLLIRGPFYRAMAAKMGRERARVKPPSHQRSLSLLAAAIIGSRKEMIESVFGPPRSTAIPGVGVVIHPQKIFWQTDLWYYPLVRNRPMAMAINFSDDHATRVEFFTSPHSE
jgi:hypothetical protein